MNIKNFVFNETWEHKQIGRFLGNIYEFLLPEAFEIEGYLCLTKPRNEENEKVEPYQLHVSEDKDRPLDLRTALRPDFLLQNLKTKDKLIVEAKCWPTLTGIRSNLKSMDDLRKVEKSEKGSLQRFLVNDWNYAWAKDEEPIRIHGKILCWWQTNPALSDTSKMKNYYPNLRGVFSIKNLLESLINTKGDKEWKKWMKRYEKAFDDFQGFFKNSTKD